MGLEIKKYMFLDMHPERGLLASVLMARIPATLIENGVQNLLVVSQRRGIPALFCCAKSARRI